MGSRSKNSGSAERQRRTRSATREVPWGTSGTVNHRCSRCGRVVPSREWHPVATLRSESDELEIHDFCDEDCLTAWKRDRET